MVKLILDVLAKDQINIRYFILIKLALVVYKWIKLVILIDFGYYMLT